MEDRETFVVEVNSVEEALHIGSLRWSIDPSGLEVEVLGEGKRLFGILGKKMRVSVSRGSGKAQPDPSQFLQDLLTRMDLSVEPVVGEDGNVNLAGEDAGIVIGRYGETLKAVEFVTNLVLRDIQPESRIRLDSDGYRMRRQESVEKIALAAAREVQRKGRPIRLEPMSSWERRIVHITLQERDDVETSSVGTEPMRRVVVSPCRKNGSRAD
ncbi:MAG: RNA-binding cell elongation regulator Jag/EloR [Thermovirgaceae bacterium]|nr:RNA-binding cell elongation regulator Jag/EloR [Thermovirgaceae bacterium]